MALDARDCGDSIRHAVLFLILLYVEKTNTYFYNLDLLPVYWEIVGLFTLDHDL